MPQVKTAKRSHHLVRLKQATAVVLWLALLGALRTLPPVHGFDTAFAAAALVGAGVWVLVFSRVPPHSPGKALACPQCEAKIEQPLETSGEGGEPVLYFCFRCDVLWFVGSTTAS